MFTLFLCLTYFMIKTFEKWDLPGCPVVKASRLPYRGHRFDPWLRNLRSHTLHGMAKIRKKKVLKITKSGKYTLKWNACFRRPFKIEQRH